MSDNKIIVLAFSGGLDTSYCVLDLKRRGYDVHTAFVDTGGVSEEQKASIEQRALALGATRHHTVDAAQDLWDEFVVPLVWSHARMLDQYPMLCSDRYVIVRKCLDLATDLGSKTFAHGCTGMGNDQLRFDQTVRSLGDFEIVAPIRELQSKTDKVRDYEIRLLGEAGFEPPAGSSRYSVNENLLGTTISGSEIDEFQSPAQDTWQLAKPRAQWPTEPLSVRLTFEKGQAVKLNDQPIAGPHLLRKLNEEFGAYGVGRHIYTGDVSIGLKGRIVFECPGVDALLAAHRALEETTNTRYQNGFRHTVAARWAELVYTGFFYEPHKFDLEAYLASSQVSVSGTVTLTTHGGALYADAVESSNMLRDPKAVYAQSAAWSPEEAVGFIKLLGQSSSLSAKINGVRR